MNRERFEELMVKVVDGLASPSEEQELMAHVATDPALSRELDAHRALKATTDGWVSRLRLDLAEDGWQAGPGKVIERRFGASLVVMGLGVLTGWGLVEAMLDASAPLAVRVGLGLLGAGSVVLLLSVLWWRIVTAKHDRYNEVIR